MTLEELVLGEFFEPLRQEAFGDAVDHPQVIAVTNGATGRGKKDAGTPSLTSQLNAGLELAARLVVDSGNVFDSHHVLSHLQIVGDLPGDCKAISVPSQWMST